ncbi:MAG: hypothetical protein ACFB0B_06795 [Thermonemataceae bacterium]
MVGSIALPFISPKYAAIINSILGRTNASSTDWQFYHKHANGVSFYTKIEGDRVLLKAVNHMTFDVKVEVKLAEEPAYSWTPILAPGAEAIRTYVVGYYTDFQFIMDANPVPFE